MNQPIHIPTSDLIGPEPSSIVQRIDVGPDQVEITFDQDAISGMLGLELKAHPKPLQIVVPVCLKRSGPAMRLVLETGQGVACKVDDNLVEAIATAHRWWQQIIDDPTLRISALAKANGVNESWVTRVLRLAFLGPTMVEQILAGQAPVHLTSRLLREKDSDQRGLHRIDASI